MGHLIPETLASALLATKYVCLLPGFFLLIHGVVRGVQWMAAGPTAPFADLRRVFTMDTTAGLLLLLFAFFAWIPGLELDYDPFAHDGDDDA